MSPSLELGLRDGARDRHAGTSPFSSYFMGGFECSTMRRIDGRRLDLLTSTRHDPLFAEDYQAMTRHGIASVRDGLRWAQIETHPRHYDWSSVIPHVRAARDAEVQVVWDLCHYGWPEDLDIWSADFTERFAHFAQAAARVIGAETGQPVFMCTINEISFWAWAGGEVGRFGPFEQGRGGELKRQLVRASIAATHAVRTVDPNARFLYAEPGIHVIPTSSEPADVIAAETYRLSQFEALDMLAGRVAPELGGSEDCLDVIGVNYYPDNQWWHGGGTVPLGHHAYRPLRELLDEIHGRYRKPLILSETGAEGTARASWLHYVCAEARAARQAGVPLQAICLYPILDYPGWDNDRPCEVGLLSMPDGRGRRYTDAALADELRHQRDAEASFAAMLAAPQGRRPTSVHAPLRAGVPANGW